MLTGIVKAALTRATENQQVIVVADDTDILVLLVYHFKPTMNDIYLNTSGKKKIGEMVIVRSVQANIGIKLSDQILVIHALSGCDTTFELFGISKSTVFKKFTSSSSTQQSSEVVCNEQCTVDQVAAAGCKLLAMVYIWWKIIRHAQWIKTR